MLSKKMMAVILSLSSLPRSSQVLIEASARFRVPFAPSSSREGQTSWLLATSTWATGWSGKLDLTWVFILMWGQTCRRVARIAVGDQVIGAQGSGPGSKGLLLTFTQTRQTWAFHHIWFIILTFSLPPSSHHIYTLFSFFFFFWNVENYSEKALPQVYLYGPTSFAPIFIHVAFYP